MKNKQKMILDIVMALGFVLMFNIKATGLTVHEIVGLLTGVIMITHILINWRWVVGITKKIFTKIPAKTRLSYILNVFLFLTMIIFILSGVLISRVVVPFLGIQLNILGNLPWRTIHIFSGELAVLIIGVHIGLHWNWMKSTVRKVIGTQFKYGKQLVQVLAVVTLLVGGVSAIATVGKASSQAISLASGKENRDFGGRERIHNNPFNNGQVSSRSNQRNLTANRGEFRPNFNRERGRDSSFNFFPTLLLVLQYLLTFGAISMATYWIERIIKKPSLK